MVPSSILSAETFDRLASIVVLALDLCLAADDEPPSARIAGGLARAWDPHTSALRLEEVANLVGAAIAVLGLFLDTDGEIVDPALLRGAIHRLGGLVAGVLSMRSPNGITASHSVAQHVFGLHPVAATGHRSRALIVEARDRLAVLDTAEIKRER